MSGGIKHIRSLAKIQANRVDKTDMAITREIIKKEALEASEVLKDVPKTLSPVPAEGLGKLFKARF